MKNRLPGYARMFNRWQVESIYVPVPGAPLADSPVAVSAQKYQAASAVTIRSWMDTLFVADLKTATTDSCLLECRRLKPAITH
jgi:hypothetical protein